MAINVAGGVTGAKQEVETGTLAARFTHRPIDVGALGSYSVSVKSGIMAAGLAGSLCYPRNVQGCQAAPLELSSSRD